MAEFELNQVVRYDYGSTALMRLTSIRDLGNGSKIYYGKGFHSHATCTSRGTIYEASDIDLMRWRIWHDGETDAWLPGGRILLWVSHITVDNNEQCGIRAGEENTHA